MHTKRRRPARRLPQRRRVHRVAVARPDAGSKREALLAVIRENPAGLSRGEILQHMGLKGDKAGEMSVSNALTALAKGNQVRREGGKYRLVACGWVVSLRTVLNHEKEGEFHAALSSLSSLVTHEFLGRGPTVGSFSTSTFVS